MNPCNQNQLLLQERVEEVPIAIVINGINYSVMLASPYDIDDFVVGYLHSESIIRHNHDVHDIEIKIESDAIIVDVVIANRCSEQLRKQQRRIKGTSGCGLCGIQALELAFPKLPNLHQSEPFNLARLSGIKSELRDWQTYGKGSGALHASFLIDAHGGIKACREDIGRHNALDKLIGHIVKNKIETKSSAILVTSRCSVELVQKTILVGIEHLISLASPSTLAVKIAKQHNLTLIHIPKHDAPYYLTGVN